LTITAQRQGVLFASVPTFINQEGLTNDEQKILA
jgi:hypothetical protein